MLIVQWWSEWSVIFVCSWRSFSRRYDRLRLVVASIYTSGMWELELPLFTLLTLISLDTLNLSGSPTTLQPRGPRHDTITANRRRLGPGMVAAVAAAADAGQDQEDEDGRRDGGGASPLPPSPPHSFSCGEGFFLYFKLLNSITPPEFCVRESVLCFDQTLLPPRAVRGVASFYICILIILSRGFFCLCI